MNRFVKAAIIAINLLQSLVAFTAFSVAPTVGSAYLTFTNPRGESDFPWPWITASVSLPLLRIEANDAHERPVTRPWVALIWTVLMAGPLASALAIGLGRSPSLVHYLLAEVLTATVWGFLIVVVVGGLAAPIACA